MTANRTVMVRIPIGMEAYRWLERVSALQGTNVAAFVLSWARTMVRSLNDVRGDIIEYSISTAVHEGDERPRRPRWVVPLPPPVAFADVFLAEEEFVAARELAEAINSTVEDLLASALLSGTRENPMLIADI